MHCTWFKGNYETHVICDMWKHALIARIHQQTCARCEKKTLPCFICGERLRSMHRMFRTCKTVENKTSETRQDKTRQDKTDETRHTTSTAEIPASDAANASDVQDYTRHDKTRRTKHDAQPQRSQPRMQRMLRKCKTMDEIPAADAAVTASEVQD